MTLFAGLLWVLTHLSCLLSLSVLSLMEGVSWHLTLAYLFSDPKPDIEARNWLTLDIQNLIKKKAQHWTLPFHFQWQCSKPWSLKGIMHISSNPRARKPVLPRISPENLRSIGPPKFAGAILGAILGFLARGLLKMSSKHATFRTASSTLHFSLTLSLGKNENLKVMIISLYRPWSAYYTSRSAFYYNE